MVELERRICTLLQDGQPVSLDSLGGEAAIWSHAEALSRSPLLDTVLQAICTRWNELTDRQRATDLIIDGLSRLQRPRVLADCLDVLLSQPLVFHSLARDATAALISRVHDRSDDLKADIAARCLDGAMRLSLASSTSRFPVLDALTQIGPDENRLFATPAARLVGVAYEQWRIEELLPIFDALLNVPGSEGDAAYEMGMCRLLDALDAAAPDEVLDGMRVARRWLARAAAAEDERADATIIGSALDVVLAFASGAGPVDLQSRARELRRVVHQRHLWLRGFHESWLRPRSDAELEWLRLTDLLVRTAAELERPSWKHPQAALAQVLEAFMATRSIRLWVWAQDSGHALERIIQPRIEGSFVRSEGLRQHLEDWIHEMEAPLREVGTRLLVQVNQQPSSALSSNSQWPCLAKFVSLDGSAIADQKVMQLLNLLEARTRDAEAAQISDPHPVIDRMYHRICESLSTCRDFVGEVRDSFQDVVSLTLKFLRSRQDAQAASYGRRTAYLFAWGKAEPPLERELAEDYHDFLAGSALSGALHSEVRDIGGGRVDILIEHGTHRFVAELKREFQDASREATRTYLSQTASYQDTNITLGILLVLDLTPKTRQPHLDGNAWVEVVPPVDQDDLPRYILVVRVPGNRRAPSAH